MSAISTAPTPPKPCFVCGVTESCMVIPSIAGSQNLCLLHYYTTGAHRTACGKTDTPNNRRKRSILVDNRTIYQQLTKVQEIFAEAFIELQKEIREESARVFQSAFDSDDPLAMLLETNSSSQPRQSSFSFGNNTSGTSRRTKLKGNF